MTADAQSAQAPALEGRAIDLLRNGVFPEWWAFVPVAGKATYVKEWASRPLSREEVIDTYRSNTSYHGLGVCTGEFSGGLIALDIDGPGADARYKVASGSGYAPVDAPGTMSWTSGKPGRRQLLYRVPAAIVPELRHVKTLILREDGHWYEGSGDENRRKRAEPQTWQDDGYGQPVYEEVVLRFNACQSVVPGSPHPETKRHYRWLDYNGGEVAMAPEWVMDLLRAHRKPVQWLSDADQKALDGELGETAVPSRQIRGWFFKEEVQALLQPRLEELIFNHPVFDKYGWRERGGSKPQRMSGCPWHGGQSGTSFQYSVESGCWDCKACGTGGDVLDFLHRVERNDPYADRPQGPDLERHVAGIAAALGYDYPACVKVVEVTTKEVAGLRMGRRMVLDLAKDIIRTVRNPAEQQLALMDLADRSGLYRLDATKLKMLAHRDSLYGAVQAQGLRAEHGWSEQVDLEDFIIPGLLRKPSQVMVHARGGVGKSEMVLALAKAVGRGESIKVRGLDVQCKQGRVLWFSNDQGKSRLAAMLERQGIEENGRDKEWFELLSGWRMDQHEEFREQVHELKPSVIVMDSLGTMMEGIAKENEGDYADWIYQMSSLNGDLTAEAGFPAAAIIWIHHNTKSGDDFRGSDRLMNAMDETWALRTPSDEEEAELGVNRRILTIGKSRFDRGGDRLIVHRDLEFNYTISDMTPLVQKEGVNRTGDSTPETLVLALLAASEGPLTQDELQEALHARMRGEGRPESELPSSWGMRKYLKLWLTEGLVEVVTLPTSGKRGGRPKKGYLARGKDTRPFTETTHTPPEFFQGRGSGLVEEPHKNPQAKTALTKTPGGSTEDEATERGAANSSTRSLREVSVSIPHENEPHKNLPPETDCGATDPEDGGFFVSADVSLRKEAAPEGEEVDLGGSPEVGVEALSKSPVTGDPGEAQVGTPSTSGSVEMNGSTSDVPTRASDGFLPLDYPAQLLDETVSESAPVGGEIRPGEDDLRPAESGGGAVAPGGGPAPGSAGLPEPLPAPAGQWSGVMGPRAGDPESWDAVRWG